MTAFPAELRRFVALFNRGAFWESHEMLEGAWRATGSPFYQGLILYASAFVHVFRRNPHGVRAQLAKAEARLATYRPAYLGVDVDALFEAADAARRALDRGDVPRAPRLKLDPARRSGTEAELGPRLEGPDAVG